ncbi:DNA cytosine methyltransferase [Pseudomonas sp. RIT623]|uniref:DNA cytosine methyltransferase n=1 Tax=Pseudomonas sp. RIT623 TaxID=2559075 RepID=UPI001C49BA2E|nr:DNA cytosine methyltransferase [Pseudomonas sp. RIT623]
MHWTVVDLFSGCGGMSHGFYSHKDHFKIIGAVDLQKGKPGKGKSPGSSTQCNPTYARNIGIEPKNADLSILSPSAYRQELNLRRGELNVLISCAPCTGFSQKNSKNHVEDDPRNQLVVRTGDFVEEFLPEFLVMENVKEILQGKQKHHFNVLLNRLENELGYKVWYEVHDLAELGLPQRRIRFLLIAWRDGTVKPLPKGKLPPVTVRETIAHLPHLLAGEQDPFDPMHIAPGNTSKVLDRIRATPKNGGSWSDIMNDPKLTAEDKEYLLIPAMFRARPGSFPDVYGRLWWDRPAITITRECGHTGNGRYLHPEQDRLLSVREMSLLQGFPENYVFEGKLSAKYNQIGDSVPPLISKQIAAHIISMKLESLSKDKTEEDLSAYA